MFFDLEPAQEQWRQRAEELAQSCFAPRAADVDRAGKFPAPNVAALRDEGFLTLLLPGAGGADRTGFAFVAREIGKACASTGLIFAMHVAAADLVVHACAGGGGCQAALDGLRAGDLATYATSEPGTGSAWWRSHSIACPLPGGKGYALSGVKSFATSAGHADWYVAQARRDANAAPGELSVFVIGGNAPGLSVAGDWDALGARGTSSAPLRFDECPVPAQNRLGDEGEGFGLLLETGFGAYLLGISAVYVGIAEAALEATLEHLEGRAAPPNAVTVAEMVTQVDGARLALWRTARALDQCGGTMKADSIGFLNLAVATAELKLIACQTARDVTGAALSLCSGSAFKRPHPVERLFRDAQAGSLMGPSDPLLKSLLGGLFLGYPLPWTVP